MSGRFVIICARPDYDGKLFGSGLNMSILEPDRTEASAVTGAFMRAWLDRAARVALVFDRQLGAVGVLPPPPPPVCGAYVGDNDATCPQLTCIRDRGHAGDHDNVNDDSIRVVLDHTHLDLDKLPEGARQARRVDECLLKRGWR